jgi:hypothetical protein
VTTLLVCGHPISKKKADQLLATGAVLYHIVRNKKSPMEGFFHDIHKMVPIFDRKIST